MGGFRDYLGSIDDYIADGAMIGWDDMGAARRPPPRRAPKRGGFLRSRPVLPGATASPRAAAAAQVLHQPMPGVPTPGPRLEPLGFTTVTFTNVSGTTLQATATPQKAFKGSRLVVELARTGATATGLVTLSSLKIGVREALVSAQPVPVGTFAATAFGVELMMDEASPGIIVTATYVISAAPGAGDSVVVGSTVLGLTWS